MAFTRIFADADELAKKDDDFRLPSHKHQVSESYASGAASWFTGPRLRRRRLAVIAALLALAYLFVQNMPDPLGPVADRVDLRDPTRTVKGVPLTKPGKLASAEEGMNPSRTKTQVKDEDADPVRERRPKSSAQKQLKSEDVPPLLRGGAKTSDFYYDGDLKFYQLPSSLNGITHTNGYLEENKNILFAASNVQSASRLIPLACEMARYSRNHVHFAFLGRDPIELETLADINGASKECSIYWHDARPDYSDISTDKRMEFSVSSALYHIQLYMHPQAYIIDEAESEERYFTGALRAHTNRAGKSLIEMPDDATERMMWLTRLDFASLAAWNNVYVDILVHVSPGSSGSLIRLLKTIGEADYFNARTPHLTIELPPEIEESTQHFLDNFVWPPLPKKGGPHTSKITLRKRVSTEHLSPLEASVRTVESFYSARPRHSHVLLVSTQTELSPLYYHYLFYNLLEYEYGFYAQNSYEQKRLAGIALELPSSSLNGVKLNPPSADDAESPLENSSGESPFLWQAPSTNAALYFGYRWQELHSYLSHRIGSPATEPTKKMVSTAFPAFTEPLLELMRARNWYLLYPNLPDGNTVARVHNELAATPEEYTPPEPSPKQARPKPIAADTLYLESVDPAVLPINEEEPLLHMPLVKMLPDDGDLPELHILPVLSWNGTLVKRAEIAQESGEYETNLRHTIGGCPIDYFPYMQFGSNSAKDLFCTEEDRASNDAAPAPSIPDIADGAPSSEPSKTYAPVRAGLEAAIAAATFTIPNAFQLTPTPNARVKAAADKAAKAAKEVDDKALMNMKALEQSDLVFDNRPPPKPPGAESAAQAPNPAVPGEMPKDASMEDIFQLEKAKARQNLEGKGQEQLTPDKGAGGPGTKADEIPPFVPIEMPGNGASRGRTGGAAVGDPVIDTPSVEKVSDGEKQAMDKEFAAHLNRLSKDPSEMQRKVEEKLEKDMKAGRDREPQIKAGL